MFGRPPSYQEFILEHSLSQEIGDKYYSELNEQQKQRVDEYIKLKGERLKQNCDDRKFFDIFEPFRAILNWIKK